MYLGCCHIIQWRWPVYHSARLGSARGVAPSWTGSKNTSDTGKIKITFVALILTQDNSLFEFDHA